jgi:HEAT repeat protein
MSKKTRTTTKLWLSVLCLTCLMVGYAMADLSSQELRDFNKKLMATDLGSIYAVTKEINERGEKHPLFVNGLRRYLKDETLPFRFFIAETLAKIGDNYGIEYLKKILSDEAAAPSEKLNVLNSLGNTGLLEAIAIIQPYSDAKDLQTRVVATKNLLKCGVIFDVDEMRSLYEECDVENKMILLNMLSEYQEKYVPVFALALSDQNGAVAKTALDSLVKLADFGGIDTIYDKLSTISNKSVRLEAELVLLEKGKLAAFSFADQYAALNAYGRMLLLDHLRECAVIYPESVMVILGDVEKIETDEFLQQRIAGLKEINNKEDNGKQA